MIHGQGTRDRHHPRNSLPDRILLVLSVLTVIYLAFQITLFQYGKDQGIYSVVARTILDGGTPYKDAWDLKPPGIFSVYAVSRTLFGKTMHAVRIVEAISFLSLVVAFIIFTRRHLANWQAGLVGGALALLIHVQLDFWNTGQPESFGVVALSWALVLATYRSRGAGGVPFVKQIISWFFSGMLFSVAVLFKPTLGGAFLFSSVGIAVQAFRATEGAKKFKAILAVFSSYFSGAVIPLAACVMFFATKNALPDLYDTLFNYVPQHVSLTLSPMRFVVLLPLVLREWLLIFSPINTIGMLLVFILPAIHTRENEGYYHVLGVVISQIIGIPLQAKLFPYHFGALLPFTALLAGWGLWKVWIMARSRYLLLGVVMVAIVWQMSEKTVLQRSILRLRALSNREAATRINDRLHTVADVDAESNRMAADWISRNTPQELPIYIWGSETVIYDLADRASSSRYIYNLPQRAPWSRETARALLMSELSVNPPSAVIVVHMDPLRRLTGNRRDSAEELLEFHELRDFISNEYEMAICFGDLDIYTRKNIPIREP